MPAEERRRAGRSNMKFGVTQCIIGAAAIALILYVFDGPGRGPYLFPWLLVFWGLGRFVRGVNQLMRARTDRQ
jgi:hypothetical protein